MCSVSTVLRTRTRCCSVETFDDQIVGVPAGDNSLIKWPTTSSIAWQLKKSKKNSLLANKGIISYRSRTPGAFVSRTPHRCPLLIKHIGCDSPHMLMSPIDSVSIITPSLSSDVYAQHLTTSQPIHSGRVPIQKSILKNLAQYHVILELSHFLNKIPAFDYLLESY